MMIQAEFFRRGTDGSLNLRVTGHAGGNGKGENLLCAAVTGLVLTAGQALQFLYEQGLLAEKPQIILNEGNAHLIAIPTASAEAEANLVLWTVQSGLAALKYNYRNQIMLIPMHWEAAL